MTYAVNTKNKHTFCFLHTMPSLCQLLEIGKMALALVLY